MLRKRPPPIHEQVIRKEIQPSRRRNRRIEHPHCSRRRVPCIHENLPTGLLLLPVQRLKRLFRHHDFAAHFEIRPQPVLLQHRRIHAQRNRPDRLHVRRHVLSASPIPARNATRQHTILILQRNAQPVEFVLRNVLNLSLPPSLPHPPVPIAQRIIGKRVVHPQHRPRLPHGSKPFARLSAPPPRNPSYRHQSPIRPLPPL